MKAAFWLAAAVTLAACGPDVGDYPYICTNVNGYVTAHAAFNVDCDQVRDFELASREILAQAGVIQPGEHDRVVHQFTLWIHTEGFWNDSSGREIAGLTDSTNHTLEINRGMPTLLHEEIHAIAGIAGDRHTDWDRLGFFGLDTYYRNVILPGSGWICPPGCGMTPAMVTNLRNAGRDIDSFLATHPSCLNDQ